MSYLHPGMGSGPADFTDLTRLASASDTLLQGKVLRGELGDGHAGMGLAVYRG